jgi:hypothetical protein
VFVPFSAIHDSGNDGLSTLGTTAEFA